MSCFEVQVLEPNINTIEVETCINGQVTSLDIIQYDIASLEITHCVALLPSDYDTIVSGIVPVKNILGGTGIYVSSESGIFTVNASGLQPSGNYSIVGHSHLSSDISNFNTSVSGLLPVKNILSGSGIEVLSNSGEFTIAVTGNFGLTSEEVDDRIGNLLVAGQNILLDYNDSGNLLTISTVGLQPSGNYSQVGHYHNSSDILDFITSVSGLLPNIYDAAVPWTANHTLVDGTRYLAGDLVYENGRLYVANYDNESLPVSNTTYWTDVGPGYRLNIDGRDIPNIPYPVTSVNGHVGDVELSTIDLDDFTSAVSGLLPSIPSVSGVGYIVSDFNNNTYIISATGLQPSGNYSLVGHSHVSNDITDFNTSVSGLLIPYAQLNSPSFSGVPTVPTAASGTNTNQIASTSFVRTEISNLVNSAPSTLDTLNELALALGSDPNFATTIASGLANKAPLVHTHVVSDITNFNSGVSGLLPITNITGSSGIIISSSGTVYNIVSSGLAFTTGANFNSLSVTGIPVSVSGHQHNYTDIINFASGVDQTVSTLLVAGSYVNLNYDNLGDTLTISVTGVQPSGNYADSVHSHGNITSSGTIGSSSGLLVTTTANGALTTSSGISSSYITNFNSSVSGLLPVKNISAGSGIGISSVSGDFTVSVTGTFGLTSEEVDDRVSQLLVAGTGVSLTYNDPSGTLTIDNRHTEINVLSQEPQGFVNRTDSLISFDDASRTFTIQPAVSGGSYTIYAEGIKVVKSGIETVVIDSGTALNYLHFDTTPPYNVHTKTTGFNFDTDIPIAFIHWNSDINQSTFFGEERHGIRMDSVTHKWIHNTFGVQYISGLSIGGYVLLGNGSLNSHAQIDISDGVLYQEDIIVNITDDNGSNSANEFVQPLSPIAYIPVYYHSGSTGQWVRDVATQFPLKYNATGAQYNLYSGGTWTTPNVTNNRYFAMWIVATNDMNDPILSIMGQREDSSINAAENNNNWNDINLTNIPTQELRPLYRLIFVTSNTFANTPKSSLQSILDIRKSVQSVSAGVTQNDHGSLFGLADDDHSQYVHIDNARTIDAIHTFSNGLISNGLINSVSGDFDNLTVNSINVSVSGHNHVVSDIADFNSSVSGLLPVTNILGGTNISVVPSGTQFTINVSGSLGLTTEEVDDRISNLLVAGTGISLDYNDGSNTLTINSSGGSGADEIEEYSTTANFPASGDLNILYVATDTGQLYKWDGEFYYENGPQGASTGSHSDQHASDGSDPIQLREYVVPSFTSNTNNLAHNNKDVLYLSSDANNRELSGLVAPSGCNIKLLVNTNNSNTIILDHQSTNSDPSNRFMVYTAADYYLLAGYSVSILYDTNASRWRVL